MKPELFKSIERLEPASFTIVMANGAMAITTLDFSVNAAWCVPLAKIINIGNFFVFSCLLLFAALTWPFHAAEFHEDLDFPQRTAFYSAIGISFLVLAAQCIKFHMGEELAFYLWAIGCFLTLAINFAINFHFFVQATPELKLFTPVFFIPVGGLTVIPVAGCSLMENTAGFVHDILIMINALALGSGLLLYIGLFTLLLQRHYLMEHLPNHLAPTVWIHLAPIGWGGVSFLNFAALTDFPAPFARLFGSLLWGGCCWWLIMCLILTLRAIVSGKMRFTLAYWAFIFPLGSITVLSFKLGEAWLPAFYFCWCLMAFIWCVSSVNTIIILCKYCLHHGHLH